MAKWYQNAIINGVAVPARRRYDTSQHRWDTLIKPILPENGDHRLFLELGCNAGFYLRKASELGYQTLGVEKSDTFYKQAQYWEREEPIGVRIEHADINDYDIPVNYITLIAQVHYWLTPDELDRLMEKLWAKSLHVLVVSRHTKASVHKSDPRREAVMDFFKDWTFLMSCLNDKHYGLLFKNPTLREYETHNLYINQPFMRSQKFKDAFEAYIDLVLTKKRFNYGNTDYWRYMRWRGFTQKLSRAQTHYRMIKSVKRIGLTDPLIIGDHGILTDGNHRLMIAERMGIKRIICRKHE